MKKTITAIIASSVVSIASAADLTVVYNRLTSEKTNGAGISVGTELTKGLNVSVGADRFKQNKLDTDLYTVNMSYEVLKLLGVGISPTVGVGYVTQDKGKSGITTNAGLSFSKPLTKNVSVVTEVNRTMGEDKVKSLNTTVVSLGFRTSF